MVNRTVWLIAIMVAIFFFYSCRKNERVNSFDSQEYQEIQKTHSTEVDTDTLMVLISDYRSYSPTQIIQFNESSFKHGFATVVYPFDNLKSNDIIWEPSFEIDGIQYPIKEKKLNDYEMGEIRRFIKEFDGKYMEDYCSYTDDYQYILYINGRKVASAYTRSIESGKLPLKLKEAINEITSIAAPLYPNYGPYLCD